MKMRLSVMTLILGLVLYAVPALALPRINAPVNDYAGVLQPYEVERIANRIRGHQERTGNQIALLVVNGLEGLPIEDYSYQVARSWGGGQAGLNNGILVTFAVQDHRSRIEVGPGLQAQVPDSVASSLLISVRPQLRASQFGDAFYDVINTLVMRTGGVPDTASYRRPQVQTQDSDLVILWAIVVAVVLIIFLIILLAASSNRRRSGGSSTFIFWDSGGSSGGSSGGGSNDGGFDGGGGGFDGGGGSGSW